MTPSGFVFIATTNYIARLDKALYRPGRIDVNIDMKKCDYYQIETLYQKMMGRKISEEVLYHIEEDAWEPVKIISRVKDYMKSDETDEFIMGPFLMT